MKQLPNTLGLLGYASKERIEAINAKKKRKKNTKPTNLLTKQIIKHIRELGGYAERINTTGFYKQELGKWIKGSTSKGTADIHACILGTYYSIEIKTGADKQSPQQLETQNKVEASGGKYLLILI